MLSLIGEFVLMQLALTMMVRPHAKKREAWGMAAIDSMRRVIGDNCDAWFSFGAICIKMTGAKLKDRQWLFDMGMDIVHDAMCAVFPSVDDGDRYTEYDIELAEVKAE